MNKISRENQKQIINTVVVVLLVVVFAFLLRGSKPPTPSEKPIINNGGMVDTSSTAVSVSDHILGNLNAKITIVEYSDTECPFCKVFHETMRQVMENSAGEVAWVYRHYPIEGLHPKAFHEAEATECAWEQGGNEAFWEYINRIFEITPSNNGLEEIELTNIAEYIGLDTVSFSECLVSGKFKDKIEADLMKGNQDGARGTPYSVVITQDEITIEKQKTIANFIKVTGAVSFDPQNKNKMTLNGTLPFNMVNGIVDILSR